LIWRRKRAGFGRRLSRIGAVLRWSLRLALVAVVVDLFYLTVSWPDWKALGAGPVPKSNFIEEYEARRTEDRRLPRLRWSPVSLTNIPKTLVRAVILAEDARFYEHSGFDLIAFKEAMSYNLAEGRFALGASTISQQTVKNLFLTASRNPVRKWHELVLTWGMESNLNKRRILELYLNIAEFGTGIYGAQAASLAYFGVPVSQISVEQAAALAATLPSPENNNPATRTNAFSRREHKILRRLLRYPGEAADAIAVEFRHPNASDEPPSADGSRAETW
jgi:monofunctional biosynthetic peptidoglycan transglycosylase